MVHISYLCRMMTSFLLALTQRSAAQSWNNGCQNSFRRCVVMAQSGQCQSNPSFMQTNCRGACANCPQQTFAEGDYCLHRPTEKFKNS